VSTVTTSVEWLSWARSIGVDPESGPPPTPVQQQAARERQIDVLAYRIERAERAVASADDRVTRDRAKRRLEGLQRQLDALDEEQGLLDELATSWRYLCASCGTPIPKEHFNYGVGKCGRCQRGAGS
jgi:hypothetical protein